MATGSAGAHCLHVPLPEGAGSRPRRCSSVASAWRSLQWALTGRASGPQLLGCGYLGRSCIEERRCGELCAGSTSMTWRQCCTGACGQILPARRTSSGLAGALLADQGDARAADSHRGRRERLARMRSGGKKSGWPRPAFAATPAWPLGLRLAASRLRPSGCSENTSVDIGQGEPRADALEGSLCA